jgi:diguanylate cyclase (GGDEF)-like protein
MSGEDPLRDEQARIDAIRRYGLLDSGEDRIAERLSRVAAQVYDAPMAAVTVVGERRQLFRGETGLGCDGTGREEAFCDRTIRAYEPLCVPDTGADPAFRDNPLVTGPPHLRAYMGVPLTIAEGCNAGALCVLDRVPRPDFTPRATGLLHELADVMMRVMEIRVLSRTDALTGLASRRHFLDELSREVSRARRHGRPIGLAMLDLDHFKRVNDGHGHGVGDEVLRSVARRMADCLRAQDLVGRIGGEEFGIILPETDGEGVLRVARRLREAISARPFDGRDGPLSLSVSIGVATAEGPDCTVGSLVEQADEALYQAKAGGRDCVRMSVADGAQGWRIAG